MKRILSLGAGVQSTTVLLMSLAGEACAVGGAIAGRPWLLVLLVLLVPAGFVGWLQAGPNS